MSGKYRMSLIMNTHYFRLVYRSILFLCMLVGFIRNHFFNAGRSMIHIFDEKPVIMIIIWCVFAFEMTLRFFPSRYESPGCQKQFRRNYQKSGKTELVVEDNNAAVLAGLLWLVLNSIFGAFHMMGMLDDDFMLLLCCAYSVCDIICILFFCPFQTWFFRNKCCSTCRIYNWDYAMMFTPLFFVKRLYAWTLLALALGLLFRWEITFFKYPERFSVSTNDYLQCSNCKEKLCRHKKQLQPLWNRIDAYTRERLKKLMNQTETIIDEKIRRK